MVRLGPGKFRTPPKQSPYKTRSPRSGVSGVARRLFSAAVNASPVGPYVRGARAAYNIARYLTPRRRGQPGPAVVRARIGKYHTVGRYRGKFRKRKIKPMKIDKYLREGFKNTSEITGIVADPDCVYVGHSTTSGHKILTIFLQAALRKLFKKGVSWTCTNVSDPIRGYETASDGYRLVLEIKDEQLGTVSNVTYDTATADSIYRIVGDSANGVAPAWPNLYNFWANYLTSAGFSVAGSMQQPTRLSLLQRDGNITNFYHHIADIYFPHENINLMITSELKIQNRTLAATGSADAEDITNNPLIGRSYQFDSGAPRTKVDGVHLLNGVIDATGALTHRSAEFTNISVLASQTMKEPPQPHIFHNVRKTGKVYLEPGAIKKDVLTYTVRMNCYKFFQKLDWRPYSATIATAKQMKSIGKSSLFALEDMINVNLSQNISIAFEINRTEACYLSTSRTPIAQGMFTQATQSSIPS